ncbi:hypothetical protein RND81_09G140600 [Saponaria officinalis]|uniref:Uncharacterized protein n=1 Tax=Saponaria officinalis TaxID=3572 RepID=A0AAW1IKH7_SAPOF
MEEGGFTPPSPPMYGDMDYDFVDRLLEDVECWSPTVDGSVFLLPGPSISESFSHGLPILDEAASILTSDEQSCNSYHDETERWSLYNPSQISPKEEHATDSQATDSQSWDQKAIIPAAETSNQKLGFCWESDELNRILWYKPRVDSRFLTTVKDRLMSAISHLKEMNRNRDVLIQIWVPVKKGLQSFLTTAQQPHFFQPTSRRLFHYRDVSEQYEFLADEDTKQALGLPGRVFLNRVPEWTPDVRFFRQEEYPRVKFAHQYDVRGSMALPVFENGSDDCLGVVEIIMTTEKFNYRPELESVCKALETVHLRSSETLNSSQKQAEKGSYDAVSPEILNVLRTVSESHDLPLAQTWASCRQQGKGRCWHSDKNPPCVSTIDSACYVRDQQVLDFHKACSEHHLSRGQGGIVGKAFETNQPCFATDVTQFSKTDYPLAHHAKMFGLRGAVAIKLRSIYHKMYDCVLEFYLPTDLQETAHSFHGRIWQSISTVIQQTCRSFELIMVEDIKLQKTFSASQTAEDQKIQEGLASEKRHQETSSWFSHITNPQKRSKTEEPGKDLKLSVNWTANEPDLQLGSVNSGNIKQDSMSEGVPGVSSGGRAPLGLRKAGNPRINVQKTMSLQVLRQYFAGSLKDAAKSIGVCPTTLKRICRQHGIARWPSRKIKKVGHSLKKLQQVINSVQGAEGSIQLSSFYTNFPELNSQDTQLRGNDVPTENLNDQSKQHRSSQAEGSVFSSGATTSNSASTSSSHTSTSGNGSPSGAKISSFITTNASGSKDTSSTKDIDGSLKRVRSEAGLQVSAKKEQCQIQERSQSNEAQAVRPPFESTRWPSRDTGIFKAKATFGEERVRFTILPNMGFRDLQQEMAKRFDLADWSKIGIKYLDDDKEWVLLTCDADLEECIDIQRSSGTHTIKLALSHITSSSNPIVNSAYP